MNDLEKPFRELQSGRVLVSIRPRHRARGKGVQPLLIHRCLVVSIRPRHRARGKVEGLVAMGGKRLFQSAPAIERGGKVTRPILDTTT